jgi:hypothetical protein
VALQSQWTYLHGSNSLTGEIWHTSGVAKAFPSRSVFDLNIPDLPQVWESVGNRLDRLRSVIVSSLLQSAETTKSAWLLDHLVRSLPQLTLLYQDHTAFSRGNSGPLQHWCVNTRAEGPSALPMRHENIETIRIPLQHQEFSIDYLAPNSF